jgi:hypothetical protein
LPFLITSYFKLLNIYQYSLPVPHYDGHICDHLWLFFVKTLGSFKSLPKYCIVTVTIVTICDSVLWRLKAVTMNTVIESFKNPSLSGYLMTVCDFVYFYTSLPYSYNLLIYVAAEQIIIKSTFDSGEVTSLH